MSSQPHVDSTEINSTASAILRIGDLVQSPCRLSITERSREVERIFTSFQSRELPSSCSPISPTRPSELHSHHFMILISELIRVDKLHLIMDQLARVIETWIWRHLHHHLPPACRLGIHNSQIEFPSIQQSNRRLTWRQTGLQLFSLVNIVYDQSV